MWVRQGRSSGAPWSVDFSIVPAGSLSFWGRGASVACVAPDVYGCIGIPFGIVFVLGLWLYLHFEHAEPQGAPRSLISGWWGGASWPVW